MSTESQDWLENFRDLHPEIIKDEKVKKKENTLALNVELSAMDYGDKKFYTNLSSEHKKEINIWLLMRYMSSSQKDAEHHLMIVNDLVNYNFNNLTKHPELQWKLLAICGTKKQQFHPWIPPPKGFKKNRIEEALMTHFPFLKDSDLELLLNINSNEELKEFFKDNGYDDKAITELFKNDSKKR